MSEAQFTDQLVAELRDAIRDIGAGNIAAFIAEPIQGAGRRRAAAGRVSAAHERVCSRSTGFSTFRTKW